jgi:hypothetical protein
MTHKPLLSRSLVAALALATLVPTARADENLLGYTTGAETLPQGATEGYFWYTQRNDKGSGHYAARDYKAELEYGFTHRFTGSLALHGLGIDTHGLSIDGYLPKDERYGFKASGIQLGMKYNILSPVKDGLGLSIYVEPSYFWKDPHSGQDKDSYKLETQLLLQKNFMDDTLVWVGNLGFEGTWAKRKAIAGLPPGFDWPTTPEMEIELSAKTGVSYRFAPNWFVGGEVVYQTEFETEVGQERWSVFAGPSLHYGSKQWWATLTWMPQLAGGGASTYPGQPEHLHLVEKTKQEIRLKLGYNF